MKGVVGNSVLHNEKTSIFEKNALKANMFESFFIS